MLLAQVENEIRDEANRRLREIEQEVKEEADERARKIIATTMQRLTSEVVSESTVSVVPIPSEDMKGRIIGREGRNIRSLEHATGVDVIIDDTPDAVTLSAFDPVRREVARIALTKLLTDGRIHPARIEEMVEKAKQGSRRTRSRRPAKKRSSRRAAPGLHPEIVRTLGRLKYPLQLRPEPAAPRRRDGEPGRDDRPRARRQRRSRPARRPAARHRQGDRATRSRARTPRSALSSRGATASTRRRPLHRGAPRRGRARHRRGGHHDRRRRHQRQPPGRAPRVARALPEAARSAGSSRQRLPRRREVVRHPGRPRDPHHRQAGRGGRPGRRAHGQGDQQAHPGEPGLPGPGQGHRDPRAALHRIREVEATADVGRAARKRTMMPLNVLLIGDIVGKLGRRTVAAVLPELAPRRADRPRHRQRREHRRRPRPDAEHCGGAVRAPASTSSPPATTSGRTARSTRSWTIRRCRLCGR